MPAPTRRTAVIAVVAAVAAVAAVAGLALFQPWRLVTDTVVDEALPGTDPISMTPSSTPPPTESGAPYPVTTPRPTATGPRPATSTPPGPAATPTAPVVLARGTFVTHEHDTTGTVAVVRLPDGSRILRLEDLDTSDGPDLEVWITDAPVLEGRAGWHAFDDGRYRDLGELKGNKGSQNYVVPADLDLADFRSVSIWCDRFNVSFGAATLGTA